MTKRAPLPRPSPGSVGHLVTIALSDAEYACLCALAQRWGSESPATAARGVLLMDLRARWVAEQPDAESGS
jgi:hypothetical protein